MSEPDIIAPMPASSTVRYEVRAGDAGADADTVVQIWHDSGFGIGGPAHSRARYEWFYLGNPEGQGQLNLLFGNGVSPVGFLGIGPRRFLLGGESVRGGLLVDFVVLPEHRTAVPALALQREGRQRAAGSMQFVYGLPDTKAVMVFKRLGAEIKFDLPTFARPVRFASYFARHLPRPLAVVAGAIADTLDRILMGARLATSGLRGAWANQFDDRFDRLWSAVDKREFCIGVRDRTYLTWRFGRQPGKSYRTFIVTRQGSDELLAYFVCEANGGVLNIKDCLSVGDERQLMHSLLLLVVAARELPVSVVHLQIAASKTFSMALRAALFRQRSQRPFFAMLQEPVRAQASKAHWYITQADEDV